MLVSINVEDLFVHSTFFPEPLNRSVLRYYIRKEIELLEYSRRQISGLSTLATVKKKIDDSTQIKKDLKDFFQNIEIRESVFEHGFSRLSTPSATCFEKLTKSNIERVNQLKDRVLATISSELNILDPLDIVGTMFVNMGEKLDRGSLFGMSFFRAIWENKKVEEIISEIFEQKFGPSFYELKEEIISETYRQVLLTSVDIQRRIRKRIIEYFSRGQGQKEASFKEIVRLADLVLTADSLDCILYHLQIDVPIYIAEDKTLALFFPEVSKLEDYPYHFALDDQYKRMVAHYASSVEPDMKIPYRDLIAKEHWCDFENLAKMLALFSVPEKPIVVPFSQMKTLGIDESILKTGHNPFVTIENSAGKWLLTSSILVHDAIFRFVWNTRATEHFKKVGSSFEDDVTEYFVLKFPGSHLRQHVIFHRTGSKELEKKYELDILAKLGKMLVCVECKDYVLIEDPDDFRLMAKRTGTLINDCCYFDSKIRLLLRYFPEFCSKNSEFVDAKLVIPVIVAMYPDVVPFFQGIPVMTKYELVRLLNFLIKTNLDSLKLDSDLFFKDASTVNLKYKISKID